VQLYTIGGYGHTESSFMRAIEENGIQAFIDIRHRRGMRGSAYAFLNAKKLQSNLESIGVTYIHLKSLAPTNEIRTLQKDADSVTNETKRGRAKLSEEFIQAYTDVVLGHTSQHQVLEKLEEFDKVCLFCVEKGHEACHRSIVAEWLEAKTGRAKHI